MEFNFEGHEMQKWNIPTDRAQKVDQKNGIICLVIMFTPGCMVIKMSQMAHFFAFSADDRKKPVAALDRIFKCIWKISFSSFRKRCGLLRCDQPLKTHNFGIILLSQQFVWYLHSQYFTNGKSKAY